MYKLLLITKYLRRKLAPLFAALAVTLCTAMVIIVISVMGGFLEMMRGSVRKLTGDVMMRGDMTGFAHYQQILDDLRRMPEVAAATPMIQSYGLAKLNGRIKTVEIVGIDPPSFDAVTGFAGTLHWNTANLQEQYERSMGPREDLTPAQRAETDAIKEQWGKLGLDAAAMAMKPPATWSRGDGKGEDAAVPGIAMWNRRDSEGHYGFDARIVGNRMTLTMLRVQQKGMIDQPAVGEFMVVNEFKSGLYEIDANRIFIKLDLMQKKLAMDEAEEANPDTGEPTGKKVPARVTEIMVRAKPGVPVEVLRDKIDEYTNDLALKHPDLALYPAMTWKERHARLLGAVEKEKFLLTILFAIISVVAVAMIAVLFYMIVLEKTRDIGVLRALGASRGGIASIFLGYGLAIGVIGSGMGLALASLIVNWINEIQDFLATYLGVTLFDVSGAAGMTVVVSSLILVIPRTKRPRLRNCIVIVLVVAALGAGGAHFLINEIHGLRAWLDSNFGFRMWDPQIYYFDKIPAALNWSEVGVILLFAVTSSVVGSVVPALLAARVDPVEAIRYE